MNYEIIVDVACDISDEIAKLYNIHFIPMSYSFGDQMLVCDGNDSNDKLIALYKKQREGDTTSTSQISPYMYEEYFEPFLKENKSIIYLSLSSGLSSTFQSANIATNSLEEKYPGLKVACVDSLSATAGIGILAEIAGRNRDEGMSLEDNVECLNEAKTHLKHWFMVEDLMYLKRGGRVSSATAIVGTMLAVKPILTVNENGKLEAIAKARGLKAAAKDIINRFIESYDPNSQEAIYLLDADERETSDYIKETLLAKYPNIRLYQMVLSPIIGAHTGPGLVALAHKGR